ncbi:MAG: hypothetical protein WCJ30_04440 [Deltaproteobacteria bacterium]
MKITRAFLPFVAAASMSLAGCQGVHYANMVTLAVTFGLFFGTLNLGRRASTAAPVTAATTSVDRPGQK